MAPILKTREPAPFSVSKEGPHLRVGPVPCLDLAQTLDCGQAFRWRQLDDGRWQGVAGGRILTLGQASGSQGVTLTFYHTAPADFEAFWRRYFDLDRDYPAILAAIRTDPVLAEAADVAGGIRLLRQEPWEALCSFIISQNNNIPRIKGIIHRLCAAFGDPLEGPEGVRLYAFPPPERLAGLSVSDLADLRAGFRAKYILDAAQKAAEGQIDLAALSEMPLEAARDSLMQIKGVGPKVADCALLFGAGRIEAFPADVWIKRAMVSLLGGRLPDCAKPYAGIVQQYIFHYARTIRLQDSCSSPDKLQK